MAVRADVYVFVCILAEWNAYREMRGINVHDEINMRNDISHSVRDKLRPELLVRLKRDVKKRATAKIVKVLTRKQDVFLFS